MENFIEKYNVSRETYERLERYVALLVEWQGKFNLVSKNSLPLVWERHIADSAQLFKFIGKDDKSIYDLGSGAGFPGLVLAIMAKEKRPDIKFKLIESMTKKTLYLNAVKDELGLDNVEVLNDRVENLKLPPADIITARAVTVLDTLLRYSMRFYAKNTVLMFLKGKTYKEEVGFIRRYWSFKMKAVPNELSSEGVVLLLSDLRRKSK